MVTLPVNVHLDRQQLGTLVLAPAPADANKDGQQIA